MNLRNSQDTVAAWKGMLLPRRPFKDGLHLSIVGFGGTVVCGLPQSQASRRVAEAHAIGMNYFDCAPAYGNGEAEITLGYALQGIRSSVFLAEKTRRRDGPGARHDLEQTLRRFHTDYLDLYQFHAVGSLDEAEQILAPGGAAETFFEAKRQGKVRYLGVAAHDTASALRLIDSLDLDCVLFPVNINCWESSGFGREILACAKSKGLARLALKALALGKPPLVQPQGRRYPKCAYQPIDDRNLAELALRFTLSQDITAVLPPGDERIFDLALDLARAPLPPLSAVELERLKAAISGVRAVFDS